MVAPRMLGPEVRRCYEEGIGFITAFGVHRDVTGRGAGAHARRRQGHRRPAPGRDRAHAAQEAVLDLAVEQALSPALTAVNTSFVQVMLEQGIPIEAIITELVLSGEVERTYRSLREVGYAAQLEYHSPTSQYGQLSRGAAIRPPRRRRDDARAHRRHRLGRFADEWDAERDAGYPKLATMRAAARAGGCSIRTGAAHATRQGRAPLIAAVVERTHDPRPRHPRRHAD